jgi:uncharacterized DUF497 family protein
MKISDYDFLWVFAIVFRVIYIYVDLCPDKRERFAQLTQFTDQPYLIFTQDVVKKDEEKMVIRYFHLTITLNANHELKDTKGIFLISSRNPELGEWSDLVTYVEDNIGGIKDQALLFSLDCITKNIVE